MYTDLLSQAKKKNMSASRYSGYKLNIVITEKQHMRFDYSVATLLSTEYNSNELQSWVTLSRTTRVSIT